MAQSQDAASATTTLDPDATSQDATPTGVALLLDGATTLKESADILAAAAVQAGVTDPTQLSQIVTSGLAAVQSGGNGTAAVTAAMATAESNGALTAIKDKATAVVAKAGELIGDLAGVKVPGVYDLPGIGDDIEGAVEGGLSKIAKVVDWVLGGLGTNNTVVLGPGGVSVTIEAPNTPTPGGTATTGPKGTANNTTVVIGGDAGKILRGGTLGGIFDDTEGVITGLPDSATLADLVLMGACYTRGGTYNKTTKVCTEDGTTPDPCIAMRTTCAQTNEVPNAPCTGCVAAPVEKKDEEEGGTTVTIGGDTTKCTGKAYAIQNPIKCASFWQNCKDGTWILSTATCPENKIICPDAYVNAKQEVDNLS
jgi:hypothetical protein